MRITAKDLLPGTDYVIQVRSVSGGFDSEWSPSFAFTTVVDDTAPKAPAGVTWISSGTGFYAQWLEVTEDIADKPAVITSYELELTAGEDPDIQVKIVTVVAQHGQEGQWTLDYDMNSSLFGSPQSTISLRVRAVNIQGIKGDWSDSVTASNDAPADVTNFVAEGGINLINLTWDANTDDDLDHYEVFIGTEEDFEINTDNIIFSGLATAFVYYTTTYTTLYFKIYAVDKFGQKSLHAAEANAEPISPFVADVTPPPTPTSLAGTIVNNGNGIGATVTLTWDMDAPDDLSGFNIRYRKVGETPYLYQSGIDGDARTSTISLDSAYTNYEFQIQSYDFSNNQSSWSATTTVTSPANVQPENVSGLSATAGKDSIVYTWTQVSDQDIKNYEVTFSTSSTFASGNITYLTGTSTTLAVSGLDFDTEYYARVRAIDSGGLTSASFSSTVSATTGSISTSDGSPPSSSPTPTVAGGLGYLFVSWDSVTNADPVTYEVHISTTSGFTPDSSTMSVESMSTYAGIEEDGSGTALAYGTTYYVKIIAKDVDGSASAGSQASGQISQVGVADVGSGAITTNALAANSVTANKLDVVTGGGNLATNTNNGITTGWGGQAGGSVSTDSGTSGVWIGSSSTLKVNLATTAYSGVQKQNFTLLPNTKYTLTGWVKLPSAAGTTPTGGIVAAASGAGFGSAVTLSNAVTTTDTWQRVSTTFLTNSTATPVNLVFDRISSSANSTEYFNLDAVQLELGDVPTSYAPRADEILPGTIVGNMIQADFITGTTFTVGSAGYIESSNYSSGSAGWRIGTTGIEMNDDGSTIKVDALKAGTIGGSSGSGIIQVAAGTSINMNGGYIKSNTNTGTDMASAVTSGSGFYLGNDGLFIGGGTDGGQIKANALISDTLTSTTITLGSGGSIVGGGWTLNSSGLTIPNGAISAASLNVQTGKNLMPPEYSDFEANSSFYNTSGTYQTLVATNANVGISLVNYKVGTQSLSFSPTNTTNGLTLAKSSTDYNITVNPGSTYIVSYYAMVASGGTNATPGIKISYSGGSVTAGAPTVLALGTWTRYSTTVTVPSGTSGSVNLGIYTNTSTGTVFFDGFQIEEQLGSSTSPSAYGKPGATAITGDMIRTGSLISNRTTVVNSQTIPYWNINANGSASFANLQVRGAAVIGVPGGTDGGQSNLSSGNYVTGTTGWQIKSDGSAEFNGATLKGGAITGTSFSTGNSNARVTIGDDQSTFAFVRFYGNGTEDWYGDIITTANSSYGLLQIDGPAASASSGAGMTFETYGTSQSFTGGGTGFSDINLVGDVINLAGNLVKFPPSDPKILRRCTNFPSFNSGALVTVDFNQNDLTSWFSASSGSYTVQVADYYMIHAIIKWITLSGTTGRRQIGVYINDTVVAIKADPTTNSSNYSTEITHGQFLNIGDVITIKVLQNSDSFLQADSPGTNLQVWRLV